MKRFFGIFPSFSLVLCLVGSAHAKKFRIKWRATRVRSGLYANTVAVNGIVNPAPRDPSRDTDYPKGAGNPTARHPPSQIVGVKAVLNVLLGKYKMITNQVKDLVYGLYGKTPRSRRSCSRAKNGVRPRLREGQLK